MLVIRIFFLIYIFESWLLVKDWRVLKLEKKNFYVLKQKLKIVVNASFFKTFYKIAMHILEELCYKTAILILLDKFSFIFLCLFSKVEFFFLFFAQFTG